MIKAIAVISIIMNFVLVFAVHIAQEETRYNKDCFYKLNDDYKSYQSKMERFISGKRSEKP